MWQFVDDVTRKVGGVEGGDDVHVLVDVDVVAGEAVGNQLSGREGFVDMRFGPRINIEKDDFHNLML